MRRGELTKRVLEHLRDASADMVYLFAAIVVSPYGAPSKQIERKMWELREGKISKQEMARIRKKQQNFYSMMHQLEKQGFIKKTKDHKFLITVSGKERCKKVLQLLPERNYKAQQDPSLKVIAFDIPEKQKYKREWLRRQLIHLGFKMIQKSVWMGKKKIPKEFVEDIRDLKLLACVEIFSITKTGSIRTIK